MKKYLGIVALLLMVMAFSCGGDDPPTPTPTPRPTKTSTPVDTATPVPTDTPVPVPTNTATAVPTNTATPSPIPPTNTPTDTPVPPTETPVVDPCSQCSAPDSFWCKMYPLPCQQCWAQCGQPIVTPTPSKTPTRTPTITPTPDPSNPCPQCPDPLGFSCQMWPQMCYQCWSDCGHPLATPTPTRTATPRPPTATPTPNYSDFPKISATFEGYPTHCTWVFTHTQSGSKINKTTDKCGEFNQSFPLEGEWRMVMTAHYAHEAEGGLNSVKTAPNGDKYGDLDGDKLYEYRAVKLLNVLPRP